MLVVSPDKHIQHGSKEVFGGIVPGPANALGWISWRVSGAPILGPSQSGCGKTPNLIRHGPPFALRLAREKHGAAPFPKQHIGPGTNRR